MTYKLTAISQDPELVNTVLQELTHKFTSREDMEQRIGIYLLDIASDLDLDLRESTPGHYTIADRGLLPFDDQTLRGVIKL